MNVNFIDLRNETENKNEITKMSEFSYQRKSFLN